MALVCLCRGNFYWPPHTTILFCSIFLDKIVLDTLKSRYHRSAPLGMQTLSRKEFQITEMMMQQPHTIISTEQFMTHIWGWDANVDTSVVWVHISNLRKKIAAIKAPIEIRFVRNAGYMLEDRA